MVLEPRPDAAGAAVGLAGTLVVVVLAGSVPYALPTVLVVTGVVAGSVGAFLLSSGGTSERSTGGVPGDGLSNATPPSRVGGGSPVVRGLAMSLLSLSACCFVAAAVRAFV